MASELGIVWPAFSRMNAGRQAITQKVASIVGTGDAFQLDVADTNHVRLLASHWFCLTPHPVDHLHHGEPVADGAAAGVDVDRDRLIALAATRDAHEEDRLGEVIRVRGVDPTRRRRRPQVMSVRHPATG
jgi:hypothetical protein